MMDIKITRTAVAVYFFVSGFLHANLMARLPQFQAQLGLSDGMLGALLLTTALGALASMLLTSRLIGRFGSHTIARTTGLLFCLIMLLIPLAENDWQAWSLFLLMGLSVGAMDVCMNGQAVYVERLWQRPIMSSFHAVFSIGMAMGAGAGALFSKLDIGLALHLGAMALPGAALVWWAAAHLLPEKSAESTGAKSSKAFVWPTKAILPLGIIAFCCMTGEGAMADWSALYMNKVVEKGAAFSAVAFGVYTVGMTLGRLFGDYATQRFGQRNLLLVNALLSLLGLGMALGVVSVETTLLGFFLVGVGVSTVVPIVFSTAGNTPGIHPSVGIAMATSIGYTGFFIGPPAIGFLSDHFGLRLGLALPLVLFGAMFWLIFRFIKSRQPAASSSVQMAL